MPNVAIAGSNSIAIIDDENWSKGVIVMEKY